MSLSGSWLVGSSFFGASGGEVSFVRVSVAKNVPNIPLFCVGCSGSGWEGTSLVGVWGDGDGAGSVGGSGTVVVVGS